TDLLDDAQVDGEEQLDVGGDEKGSAEAGAATFHGSQNGVFGDVALGDGVEFLQRLVAQVGHFFHVEAALAGGVQHVTAVVRPLGGVVEHRQELLHGGTGLIHHLGRDRALDHPVYRLHHQVEGLHQQRRIGALPLVNL